MLGLFSLQRKRNPRWVQPSSDSLPAEDGQLSPTAAQSNSAITVLESSCSAFNANTTGYPIIQDAPVSPAIIVATEDRRFRYSNLLVC